MISEQIIKDEFINRTLKYGVNKVFTLQAEAARAALNEKTGRLFAELDARKFGLTGAGGHFSISVSILNYLRFNEIRNDMQLRGKLHLYNRIVWGVLYGETMPYLKFGLTDEIKKQITDELKQAGIQLELPFKF